MIITMTVTVEIDGDLAQVAAAKIAELLPDRNGVFAYAILGVVVRRLCACGLMTEHPHGWDITAVEVR